MGVDLGNGFEYPTTGHQPQHNGEGIRKKRPIGGRIKKKDLMCCIWFTHLHMSQKLKWNGSCGRM
jgi:hypothetical protein